MVCEGVRGRVRVWPGLPRVGMHRAVPMTAWQCLKDKYLGRSESGRTECPRVPTQMRAFLALTAERLNHGWFGGLCVAGSATGHQDAGLPRPPVANAQRNAR